jgi:hypothetical protein
MKKLLFIILISLVAGSAYAADVGVSVSVGQPGFYGQIDIGSAPKPELINPSPVVIEPGRTRVVGEPIYLYVPPEHAKNWKRYCAKYNACNRPVYFVRDKWYNNVYVPHYRKHQEEYRRGEHGDMRDRERGNREDRERGDRYER